MDHDEGTFTSRLAGGGVGAGMGYGATDELGFESIENVVQSWELHATALELPGIDHERLTRYHNGFEQRFTGFEGRGVIRDLIAWEWGIGAWERREGRRQVILRLTPGVSALRPWG